MKGSTPAEAVGADPVRSHQYEGLPVVEAPVTAQVDPTQAEAKLEALLDAYLVRAGVTRVVADSAWYRPKHDVIGLPAAGSFRSRAAYLSTYAHECAHSTGHASRLDREGITAPHNFGDAIYAREELVAEITASTLAWEQGVETEAEDRQSAAYLKGWLSKLREDSGAWMWAASRANAAAHLIDPRPVPPRRRDARTRRSKASRDDGGCGALPPRYRRRGRTMAPCDVHGLHVLEHGPGRQP